jgi:hypothetical protein
VLGANGYWQDEDMKIEVRGKLIIGALDPRHDEVDQSSCPGIGASGSKTRNPGCRSGFYVISYADPADLEQIGDFVDLPAGHTTSCIEGCDYVWTGGPAAQRPGVSRPIRPRRSRRRPTDLGHQRSRTRLTDLSGGVTAWVAVLSFGVRDLRSRSPLMISNAKARRELGWHPAHPSRRQGFAVA